MKVAVIGATGYVGGRLVPELLAAGHDVRCLARTPERLDRVPWRAEVDGVRADVLDAGERSRFRRGRCLLVGTATHPRDHLEATRKTSGRTHRTRELP